MISAAYTNFCLTILIQELYKLHRDPAGPVATEERAAHQPEVLRGQEISDEEPAVGQAPGPGWNLNQIYHCSG